MGYFNYHAKVKNLIKSGHYLRHEYVKKYGKISPCMLLMFDCDPYIMPIREHRWDEYEEILSAK